MNQANLSDEWKFLQTQYDDYEKISLIIKLFAIAVATFSFISQMNIWLSVILILILWFQDAIWKTFQSRIESRILALEKAIAEESELTPFQFNSQWQRSRPGVAGLIREYISHALKPTVIYPFLLLILVILIAN